MDALNEPMVNYHLRARDALRYATLQRVNSLDLASGNSHFDRILELRRYTI